MGFGVLWFVVFIVLPVPGGVRFLILKMPVFGTVAAGDAITGFGPNFAWLKIDQFAPSALFAASHTLVGGDWTKLALWYVQ